MFISKPRRKPVWDPPALNELSEDDVNELYFSNQSPNELTFASNLDMRHYPFSRYALPSEESVRQVITGDEANNRLTTEREIVEWFLKGSHGKRGVREKIADILSRKTSSTEKEGLVWNHSP